MSQGSLCPNLPKKFQKEVSQIANRNLPRPILLGGLSVNLNHLKTAQTQVWKGMKSISPRNMVGYQTTNQSADNHSTAQVGNISNSDWDSHMGGTYIGNGEWAHLEESMDESRKVRMETEAPWIYKWRRTNDEDIKIHQEVLDGGYPNRWGAKRPVKTKWNLELFQELLVEYEDREVVEWIRYGWPTGRLPTLPDPAISGTNHKGATDYPMALSKYIQKEQSHGAVMGPFQKIPFPKKVGIAPLSTRPKKESDDRRIILDLSFPPGQAVNDGISKDQYLGLAAKLTFPKVDDFALRIYTLGRGCMMFKIDLSRYFRQLPLDPGDYSMIGYIINGELYFDKVLPMGMRSAPYIAQRVTNAIAYIHRQMEFFLLNYVDDFVGAQNKENIWKAYHALDALLEQLRVDTS